MSAKTVFISARQQYTDEPNPKKAQIMFEPKSDFDCLIDEEQLAKRLGKSKSTIRKYRNAGKIAFLEVNGRIKFRMIEVKRFEESGGKPPIETNKSWWQRR